MKQHIPSFPVSPWDGLAPQYDDRHHDKWADHFMYDAIVEELKAVQSWLLTHYVFDFFDPLGPGNSIVGVSNDSATLEWKAIVAGNNVTINHDGANIVVSASGGVEPDGAANTLLGMNNDANATEWKTLIAGTGISVNHNGNEITITSTVSGSLPPYDGANKILTTNADNNASVWRSLANGANATLSINDTTITIDANVPTEVPAFDGANKFLSTNASNNASVWRTIANGANVTLTFNDTTLTIDSTAGGPAGAADHTYSTLTNNQAANINIGSPVYTSSGNMVQLARANASSTVEVIGLAKATAENGANIDVVTAGVVTATTGQWDSVTGGSGGLTAGSIYFLSDSAAGQLTTTAPSTNGSYVLRVGKALSTTQMDLSIGVPILL